MKNQTLLSIQGDFKEDPAYSNLSLILEANCFIIESLEVLRNNMEENVSSPRKNTLVIPADIEAIVKQKLEIRKSNKPPPLLSNSSSAGDLIK